MFKTQSWRALGWTRTLLRGRKRVPTAWQPDGASGKADEHRKRQKPEKGRGHGNHAEAPYQSRPSPLTDESSWARRGRFMC